MLPSATDLEYFLEVSKTLNISRASERIGISQPTLTQSIRKLESAIGTQLLIRTRTGVRLTKSGQKISNQISALLHSWGKLQQEAQQDQYELKGKFKIGIHPSVARYILPQFFKVLLQKAPQIEIELAHDLSRNITEGLINFRIDLGFVVNPVKHPDLVLKKVCDDIVTIFESTNECYSNLLFGDPELIQTQWILKQLKKSHFKFGHFVSTPNLEVIHRMVSTGAGYGILPSRVAHCEPGLKLSVADISLPIFKDQIFLAYRKEAMTSCAAKMLIDIGKSIFTQKAP
jgi:LysR family transcriptional regulator, cell division regulator